MVRKFLVVMSAALLGLSVLVLAGSPVGAANTASESLYDHDGNADTPSIRRFAGVNRFATAVSIAEAYVAAPDAGNNIDSVILVSGNSVADAAAAAPLAAAETAPVLLTDPDRLTRSVRNFIDDEFVTTVYVLGGGISADVIAQVEAISTVRTVVTLSGPDRYATSVEIAERLGEPGQYCDTGVPTAILANADNSFADVIAIGPLAYALTLPILLTPANTLPSEVAGYLLDEGVEQVIVVGGTASVSQTVRDELEDFGVETIVPLAGTDRYDTAVEVYDALTDCATIAVSSTTVGLVNADSTADGVVAAPLLGAGLSGDGTVTPVMLVATDELPAATATFLAGRPLRNAAATYTNFSVTAIGNTSAVTEDVMDAAIASATTSKDLTAEITAVAGTNTVTIKFSDAVNAEASTATNAAVFATSAMNPAHYSVAGSLFAADTLLYTSGTNTLTITLDGYSLAAGNVISVAGDAITGSAATSDLRRVMPATLTVAEIPPDRARPRLEVLAAAGAHEFAIKITEDNPKDGELITKADIEWKGADLSAHSRIYYQPEDELAIVCLNGLKNQRVSVSEDVSSENVSEHKVLANLDDQFVDRCLTGDELTAINAANEATDVDNEPVTLAAGDRIEIDDEALVDIAGNQSRSVRHTVDGNNLHPEIRLATVTKPETVLDAAMMPVLASTSWTLVDPDADTGHPLAKLEISDDDPDTDDDTAFYVYLKADSPHLVGSAQDPDNVDRVSYVRDPAYGRRCPQYQSLPADNSALNYELGTTVAADQDAGGNTISTYEFHDCQSATLPTFNLFFDLQTDAAVSDIVTLVGADTTNPFILSDADGTSDDFSVLYEDATDTTVDGGAMNSFTILAESVVDGAAGIITPTTVTVTAREGGIASGATGSDWAVEWARLPDDEDKDAEVTVDVRDGSQTVLISFDDDANLDDARTAALANEEFSDNFTFSVDADSLLTYDTAVMAQFTDPSGELSRQRGELAGGESQINITLEYDEVLSTFDATAFRLANSGLRGLFNQGTITYTPATYFRTHGTTGENVAAADELTGSEELVAIDSFADTTLCDFDSTLADQTANGAYGTANAAFEIGFSPDASCAGPEPHNVILTDTIVFTIVYTSAEEIVERNDILVMPNEVARNYVDPATGSTTVDGITTAYGASQFSNRTLRAG